MFKLILLFVLVVPLKAASAEHSEPTNEKTCLVYNIYHEARNQSIAGQIAVALVTLNRVNDKRFPDTICGVVLQGPVRPSWKNDGTYYPIKNRCQFSWWCDGKSDKISQPEVYNDIAALVDLIFHRGKVTILDITEGATFYHATYVTPSWASVKERTTQIEDHIFYKWNKNESKYIPR